MLTLRLGHVVSGLPFYPGNYVCWKVGLSLCPRVVSYDGVRGVPFYLAYCELVRAHCGISHRVGRLFATLRSFVL